MTYIQDLDQILKIYKKPMSDLGNYSLKLIFEDLTNLYDFHQKSVLPSFLVNPNDLERLADGFLEFNDYAKQIYGKYCFHKFLFDKADARNYYDIF